MAKQQVSLKPAEAATTQPANEAPALNVPLEDLRLALFEAESRIADYVKTAGNPEIAVLVQFAELARNFLAEHQSRDSEATLEYLARSLAEMWPDVQRFISQPACPDNALPSLWVGLESMNDDALEQLERNIGEILAKRKPAPEPVKSESLKDATNRIRMGFALNGYITFRPPACLDEPWAKNAITSIKRHVHHLTPAELIGLSMFVGDAVRVPLPDSYLSYVQARAEQARKWFASEKAKREQRAAKHGGQ